MKEITQPNPTACTQWASGWLAFQRRASRAFPDLSSTSCSLMRRLKDLLPTLRLMQVPRCFLIVFPYLVILGFLQGLVLLLCLLGLRLLTPPLPQAGPQRLAFRHSLFFFFASWREAWVFVLLLTLTILLYTTIY